MCFVSILSCEMNIDNQQVTCQLHFTEGKFRGQRADKTQQICLRSRAYFPSTKQDCFATTNRSLRYISEELEKIERGEEEGTLPKRQHFVTRVEPCRPRHLNFLKSSALANWKTQLLYYGRGIKQMQNPKGCFDCALLLSINQELASWKHSIPNPKFSFLPPHPAGSTERPPRSLDMFPPVFSHWVTFSQNSKETVTSTQWIPFHSFIIMHPRRCISGQYLRGYAGYFQAQLLPVNAVTLI